MHRELATNGFDCIEITSSAATRPSSAATPRVPPELVIPMPKCIGSSNISLKTMVFSVKNLLQSIGEGTVSAVP